MTSARSVPGRSRSSPSGISDFPVRRSVSRFLRSRTCSFPSCAAEGQAFAGFGGQHARELAAVVGHGQIVDVAILDCPIGIENGDEQCLGRFVADGGQIGSDGKTLAFESVTGGAAADKNLAAAGRIARLVEQRGKLVDHFLPVAVAGGQQRGCPIAQRGQAMFQQLLAAGGIELVGLHGTIGQSIQQRGNPSIAAEQHTERASGQCRTVRSPMGEQCGGGTVVARAGQRFDGGGLNCGRLLRFEQRGQHGKIFVAIVEQPENADGRGALVIAQRIVGGRCPSGGDGRREFGFRFGRQRFGERLAFTTQSRQCGGERGELPRGKLASRGRGGGGQSLGNGGIGIRLPRPRPTTGRSCADWARRPSRTSAKTGATLSRLTELRAAADR